MSIAGLSRALAYFTIRQKLSGGFAIILLILSVIVAVTLSDIAETKDKVETVTSRILPTMIASTTLETAVKQGVASLGLFLLTDDKARKQVYHDDLLAISVALETLKQTVVKSGDPHTNSLVAALENDVNKFVNYEQDIVKLAEDRLQNFPAMEYARANANPINSEISQILTGMIESESDQESSDERKRLLIALSTLKGIWANVTINVRVYLYLNNDDAKSNIELFLGGHA